MTNQGLDKNDEQNYALGRSDGETKRLISQAQLYHAMTERLLDSAGISEGMRVLDVGSGSGNVALSLAKRVGPAGEVVGVDMNADILQTAAKQVIEAGFDNVSFINGDISTVELEGTFDAVVGRLVLMYIPDPVAAIKHIINYLKPNAIVAFQELDLTFYRSFTNPDTPLFNQLVYWGIEIFERTGANVKIGMELSRIFVESGLNSPKLDFSAPAGCDEHWSGYQYLQDSFQSLAPLLEKYELVSIDELNANTLAERLKNEALSANHPLILTPHVSACSQIITSI